MICRGGALCFLWSRRIISIAVAVRLVAFVVGVRCQGHRACQERLLLSRNVLPVCRVTSPGSLKTVAKQTARSAGNRRESCFDG